MGNLGYVAVLFGGTAEHLLRGVDFYVGDSGEPYCDSDSGIVEPTAREALRNILKDPMARIAPLHRPPVICYSPPLRRGYEREPTVPHTGTRA